MQRYSRADPYFRGKWSSPTESRFLRVSNITSLYKALWAGSRNSHSSWVNSMATSSEVSRSWNETTRHQKGHEKFSFSCKRERVVRGTDWLGWSMCSNRSMQGYLEKVWISNFNFLCFFLRPYEILQLTWIFHHRSKSMKYIKIKLNTVLAIQKCQILCSTQWVQFMI